jgi:O-methyltransferase involved in polyketide biosynthesis
MRSMAIRPELSGLAETALWTLWFRAMETSRDDRMLSDPLAVDVLEKIDFPFEERFGRLFPAQALSVALRVLAFDVHVRRFLASHPGGMVVALGEGLETQFWRVDNGAVRWLTVDLPDSVALRRKLMPPHERQLVFAGSALDPAWMDLVQPPVLITAQGLLMYLPPAEVHAVLARCARRFPGGYLVFDAVPPWLARLATRGTARYRPPPLLWTLKPAQLPDLARIDPAIVEVREVTPPNGRGVAGWLLPKWRHIPVLRRLRPMIVALRFAP